MNNDIKTAQELVDRKLETEDVKSEIARLKKMLKSGFSTNTDGMEKVCKVFASNDEKKIAKFYWEVANYLRAIELLGNMKRFREYAIETGINITSAPNLNYRQKGKKKAKFLDLYNEYFLEEAPQKGEEAGLKILRALEANHRTVISQEEQIKEEAENMSYSCSKRTFSTITQVLTSSKKKDIPIEDVISEVEVKLQEEQQAIDMLGETTESE